MRCWIETAALCTSLLSATLSWGGESDERQEPSPPLIQAVRQRDLLGVRRLLAAGASPDERRRPGGLSALMVAARRGRADIARLLLSAGAAPDLTTGLQETALMMASEQGHLDVVRALVEAGADLNMADSRGGTPLVWAARRGQQEMLSLLVGLGADLRPPLRGSPVLLHAIWARQTGAVGTLLELGAPIDAQSSSGLSALMAAAGDPASLRVLLSARARVELIDNDGWSALLFAAQQGRTAAVLDLLRAGADPNRQSRLGWTPLMLAAAAGHAAVVVALARAGANLDVSSWAGHTAVIQAVQRSRAGVLRELLAAGASPTAAARGRTPLWWARALGDEALALQLVEAGATR